MSDNDIPHENTEKHAERPKRGDGTPATPIVGKADNDIRQQALKMVMSSTVRFTGSNEMSFTIAMDDGTQISDSRTRSWVNRPSLKRRRMSGLLKFLKKRR